MPPSNPTDERGEQSSCLSTPSNNSLQACTRALRTALPNGWSIVTAQVHSTERASDGLLVELALRHTSGSHIQCAPFDPKDHQHNEPKYTAHRVRMRNSHTGETKYVTTIKRDHETQHKARDSFQQVTESNVTFTSQQAVHEEDRGIEAATRKVKRYSTETVFGALVAVIGCAHAVKTSTDEQAGLGDFG